MFGPDRDVIVSPDPVFRGWPSARRLQYGLAHGFAPRTQREVLAILKSRPSAGAQLNLQYTAEGGLIRTPRLSRLEAVLMIADAAVLPRKLAQQARLIDAAEVCDLIDALNSSYDRARSAFRIEQTAAGYQMMTRVTLAPWLDRLHNRTAEMKLSPPMMETLTVIAYQQPVTRADVEAVRGVQSSELIRQLLDRGLIRIAGEDDSLGRPFLYATTRQFLIMFGLRQIEELPDYDRLRKHDGPVQSELPFAEIESEVDNEAEAESQSEPGDESDPEETDVADEEAAA